MLDPKKIFTITCNCGTAKHYCHSRINKLLDMVHKQANPDEQIMPDVYVQRYTITEVLRKPEYAHLQELAKQCGVWDYLKRPGAGSDKVLLLPEINSWIDLTNAWETIETNNGKELIYLYEQARTYNGRKN